MGCRRARRLTAMKDIGIIIREKLKERDKPVVWFAHQLSCSRTNAYKIFEKRSIDTTELMRISIVLDFDFFKCYSEELSKRNSCMTQDEDKSK